MRPIPFTLLATAAGLALSPRCPAQVYSAVDNIVDGVKTYCYYPTAPNPFTTAVRLRDGSIVNIKRTRKY